MSRRRQRIITIVTTETWTIRWTAESIGTEVEGEVVRPVADYKKEERIEQIAMTAADAEGQVTLQPVDSQNWRAVAKLTVALEQQMFVAEPCYYLALCAYEQRWQPLAIVLNEQVIGFLTWAPDPLDADCCWLGVMIVDQHFQQQGYEQQALQAALERLSVEQDRYVFAIAYLPANRTAQQLYAELGFAEQDEWKGEEIVARRLYEQAVKIDN
ncbi:MAG: GNAT family N-acetyltransferase [Caldilineaceae bacterium]